MSLSAGCLDADWWYERLFNVHLACPGQASAGKTQTCMQLLMTAQWPAAEGGLDGDALCAVLRFIELTPSINASLQPCHP